MTKCVCVGVKSKKNPSCVSYSCCASNSGRHPGQRLHTSESWTKLHKRRAPGRLRLNGVPLTMPPPPIRTAHPSAALLPPGAKRLAIRPRLSGSHSPPRADIPISTSSRRQLIAPTRRAVLRKARRETSTSD